MMSPILTTFRMILSREQNCDSLRLLIQEQVIMFETAVQERRTDVPWGVIVGCAPFAVLLAIGYVFVT